MVSFSYFWTTCRVPPTAGPVYVIECHMYISYLYISLALGGEGGIFWHTRRVPLFPSYIDVLGSFAWKGPQSAAAEHAPLPARYRAREMGTVLPSKDILSSLEEKDGPPPHRNQRQSHTILVPILKTFFIKTCMWLLGPTTEGHPSLE